MSPKDLLVVGNGHGEDAILGRIVDALGADEGQRLSIDAWPMVGKGEAFTHRGLPLVGAFNLLPSGGFATLDPRLLFRDLIAGWISTHWRQIMAARA
ncbi:MAG: hypothetical protein IPL47_08990 [Phyllobacteriaceae bacterium]|nr:hypothetical protein [Phyllobacteriaceae bacterium]